jgi:hypothetical protein
MPDTLDFSQPIIEHQYAKEWHEYKVRRATLVLVYLGFFPFGFVISYLLDSYLGSNETLAAIAMISWMAVWGITIWRFTYFRCPRCGKPFCYEKYSLVMRFRPFAKKCWKCGLEKWAGE